MIPFNDETYSEFVKIVSYVRRRSKLRSLSLSFEKKITEVFWKLNDFYPTYDTRMIIIALYLKGVYFGEEEIRKMHNKRIIWRILHLSSIQSGSKSL